MRLIISDMAHESAAVEQNYSKRRDWHRLYMHCFIVFPVSGAQRVWLKQPRKPAHEISCFLHSRLILRSLSHPLHQSPPLLHT
jgi:hypothetical protein